MFSNSRFRRRSLRGLRARRGVALFLSLFFVGAIGALALSAIYLTANGTLLSKSYEKEDDLKYATEAALAIGKASLNFNPAALPNTSFVAMMTNKTMTTADAQPLNGIKVNMWVGQTGSKSGQFGRFASLVAQATDAGGSGFVRRLELTQESFAKYAYWSNDESSVSGTTIFFGNGDQLWGPVWSNDDISINSSGVTFHDAVGTAGTISGANYGVFSKGYSTHQRPITLPSLSSLSTLSGLATVGSMNYSAPTTGNETTVRMRIEFVAADLTLPLASNTGDSTAADEGFYRIYTANSGEEKWLRGDWPGTSSTLPAITSVINCGDWHLEHGAGKLKFFPAAVHKTTWFVPLLTGGTRSLTQARADSAEDITTIMSNNGARCYLGGDPHLVGVAGRASHLGEKGGEDSTFTAVDSRGSWRLYSNTPNATVNTVRPNDAKYLFPLFRGFNTSTKGVMYVAGTVGVSGVLRSLLTLYTPNTVVILDDIRYANDPAAGICADIFGIIAGQNVVVADNALNTPQTIKTSGTDIIKSLDDTPDLYLHSVIMAIGTSFTVQNYNVGPADALKCGGADAGRGCLFLTGGLIQNNRGPVGLVDGHGFTKRYSYDRCAVVNPPPYFPTTGRFQDNRYYELDPVRFNVNTFFQTLTPNP